MRQDYAGIRVLVTAGPTRESLDPVRYISNRSTGRMGYAVAQAAAARGARVTLVTGPVSLLPLSGVDTVAVETTQEMYDAVLARLPDNDVIIKAAAPADFRLEVVADKKIKKDGQDLTITLQPTPDIAAAVGAAKGAKILVAFAAETHDVIDYARRKIVAKNADLIVCNDVTAEGAGFEVETNVVTLLYPDGRREALPLMQKSEVAERILDAVRTLLNPSFRPKAESKPPPLL